LNLKTSLHIWAGLLSFGLAVVFVPRLLCGRAADGYFRGTPETQDALAHTVVQEILTHPGRELYHTGAERFDGQSAIAAYQMTILGLGQIILARPERRNELLPAMRSAAARLVDPRTLRYAERAWGQHGIQAMKPGQGHAYLGYVNLALGMLRAVDPTTAYAPLHDRLTAALADRLGRAGNGLIETYPGETWPADVAAVAGSIGLHARVTGVDRSELLARWSARFTQCAVHETGYLFQRIKTGTCEGADAPRGSGTAIAAYFLAFADPALSRRLYEALAASGRITWLGFTGLREYAPGFSGEGDGNSGPVFLGASAGATGFGLAAARVHGDFELFRGLYRSAVLVGVPLRFDGGTKFVTGGTLGNALLLAMLTANPVAAGGAR
jgi:hypothetical protein